MRIMKYLLRKEFSQIFRNPSILKMIIAVPILQLLILPLAADYEIKNINIAIVNKDHSALSQKLISKISASKYFSIVGVNSSYNKSLETFEKDEADIIMEIPLNFEKDLIREKTGELFIAANAINGTNAALGANYLSNIVAGFNNGLRLKLNSWQESSKTIEIKPSYWFNPLLNYRFFMVPGILAVLVTMVAAYMCSLNIVKEKEVGTIEQINVTPIKKLYFILGKLLPFWILAMIVFSIGLFLIARVVYGIIPLGSILILYTYLAVYLIAILGLGLLISTYSTTQQQAMSLAFFMIMIFLLMSGLFTPIESMPHWAKFIAYCSPVTYFIELMRMVVLKGSGWAEVQHHFLIMFLFALFFNTWAIMNYRKTS